MERIVRILNTTKEAIETAATTIGVQAYNLEPVNQRGTSFRVSLRPADATTYRRTTIQWWNGGKTRRVWATCWHGHRDFMRKVFDLTPAAKIRTVLAKYDSQEDFEKTFERTGDVNIGSLMSPMYASDACMCEERYL